MLGKLLRPSFVYYDIKVKSLEIYPHVFIQPQIFISPEFNTRWTFLNLYKRVCPHFSFGIVYFNFVMKCRNFLPNLNLCITVMRQTQNGGRGFGLAQSVTWYTQQTFCLTVYSSGIKCVNRANESTFSTLFFFRRKIILKSVILSKVRFLFQMIFISLPRYINWIWKQNNNSNAVISVL